MKIHVQKNDLPNYTRLTRALNNKFGSGNWRWAPWAFESGPNGVDILSSPVAWQDIIYPESDGVMRFSQAAEVVPSWRR